VSGKIKAYLDLLRVHFFFVWPTLFCAGLFFGLMFYGGFSWMLVLQAVFIAFLGFEAGFVLNDIVDLELDKKDLPQDNRMTKYWRPFGRRPLSEGLIPKRNAIILFAVLVAATCAAALTLPFPHSAYVLTIMATCYCLEAFYQIKKRNEKAPVAQVVGRVDFALFLVAGYLCVGSLDLNVLALFLFFYPLALAHLGMNDLIDVANDKAKCLSTIPTLYGMDSTVYWIFGFTLFQFATAVVFLFVLGSYLAIAGFAVSILLLSIANLKVLKKKTADAGLRALPLFHVSMLIYALTIIVTYAVNVLL
jgi:4-hydroxybenzoate polyprenyltransferase